MHNTSIHAQKYMHTNTSMLYKLLFYFPVTISYLVDEIDSPKFLQLICLTFENRFFYFPFFFQFYFIFGVFSLHTLNLLCCIGEQLINNILIVQVNGEGTQLYISMCPFSHKFPSHPGCHIIEQSSICYAIHPCCYPF